MVVSRFFKKRIQNSFSEIQNVHQNLPRRDLDPNGVVGYMRKQEVERLIADSPAKHIEFQYT